MWQHAEELSCTAYATWPGCAPDPWIRMMLCKAGQAAAKLQGNANTMMTSCAADLWPEAHGQPLAIANHLRGHQMWHLVPNIHTPEGDGVRLLSQPCRGVTSWACT